MNNDALMAALGMDAVAAVHGYRSEIVAEAALRGLRLAGAPLPDVTRRVVDPLDIRLTVEGGGRFAGLDGRVLRWGPANGWSSWSHRAVRYYAGPGARPLDLVPAAPDVLDWVLDGARRHSSSPPADVDLDDDPRAIRRLIDFVGPHRRRHAGKAVRSPHRRRTGRPGCAHRA